MSEIIHLPTDTTLSSGLTAIKNKINAWIGRIGAKLGSSVTKPVDIEPFLTQNLDSINTELVSKGSTAANDYSGVPAKIEAISTGVTPTGTVNITANGSYDVAQYAQADVAVPNMLVQAMNNTLVDVDIAEEINMYMRATFNNLTNLVRVRLRKSKNTIGQQQFAYDSKLEIVDINGASNYFNNTVFHTCTAFKTLILRRKELWGMYGTATFISTPFRNGTGGTVYVPYWITVSGSQVQGVSTYANATNWSALESTTFASIQENLATLLALGVDITDYYEVVTALPTSNINVNKVYLIETATEGTYEQWFNPTGSAWTQLADITLGA